MLLLLNLSLLAQKFFSACFYMVLLPKIVKDFGSANHMTWGLTLSDLKLYFPHCSRDLSQGFWSFLSFIPCQHPRWRRRRAGGAPDTARAGSLLALVMRSCWSGHIYCSLWWICQSRFCVKNCSLLGTNIAVVCFWRIATCGTKPCWSNS